MGDFEYPLVIGNIIHEAFESIIQDQDYSKEKLDEVFDDSMKHHFTLLYQLKENEAKVKKDLHQAAQNI